MKVENISREVFLKSGRRICVLETEEITGMGKRFCDNAKNCKYRKAQSIKLTEADYEGMLFAECEHPEKDKRLSEFCPISIARIEEEPN